MSGASGVRRLDGAASLLAAAVIGGAVIGLVEGTAMALVWRGTGADRALAWGASSALAAAGAIPLLLALLVVTAAAGRLRLVADWRRALLAGGAERAVLLWRALLVAAAAAILATATFRIAATTYKDYPAREAPLFGAFVAAVVTASGALVVFAAVAADRQLVPRIRASAWAARAADHCSLLLAAIGLAGLTVAVLHALIATALPALHPAVSVGVSTAPLVLVALRVFAIGRRRRERAIALALVAAIAAGLVVIAGSPAARLRVVSLGLASRAALSGLLRSPLTDRDSDSYPGPAVGGADCDDDDAITPRASDVAGNGVDENCTGADADPAALSARLAPRPSAVPAAPRWNLLLVSIDAVRPDHVGAWGYRRPTTPHLDRLAARATRFAWAFTPVPTTRPAITSLMIGRYPSSIRWIRRLRPLVGESGAVPLAEVLAAAGYRTAAIACCDRFERAEHELAGFAEIDSSAVSRLADSAGQVNSDAVARAAVRWLRGRPASGDPFFLWMHFIDPHAPYQVPPGGRRFGDRNVDLYDAEVRFADKSLGTVLHALEELGLDESTVVAVVSDHGEEFEEHGGRYHSRSLYNQVARIPLVVHAPGAAPRVVDTPVSIVDVMPTLLDLVGLDGPGGMNGRSLAAAVRGTGEAPARPILLEVYPMENIDRDLYAVVDGRWKVIWDREANAWSLYSLDDPDDREDRAADQPEQLAAMRALLFATVDRELSTGASQASRPRARASR